MNAAPRVLARIAELLAAAAPDERGALWHLAEPGRELDANLVRLPPGGVRLATSAACPVQAFRVGSNVYATQFHPELDLTGVCTRIEVYKDAGYFDPSEAETLKELSRSVEVVHPMTVLANFVALHAR